MGFFTSKQKRMARKNTLKELQRAYYDSECALLAASYKGDKKALRQAMKVHGDYEYAMLYQYTPEYNKKKTKYRK